METYQLKKIIIIVLALVNLSLLGLLGRIELQDRTANQQMLMHLKDLYLSSGIELSLEELPRSENQASATVQRSAKAETKFAEAFLGTAETQESGSAIQYSSALGTMRFRRNSSFELTMAQPTVSEDDCLSLLEPFGYTAFPQRSVDGSTLSLTQTLSGEAVVGVAVTLHFTDGFLTSATGYYVAGLQEGESLATFSAADALAAFLQYSLEQNLSYSSVRGIHAARSLSAETLFQSTLLPVWVIETSNRTFYVNHTGSEITRLS